MIRVLSPKESRTNSPNFSQKHASLSRTTTQSQSQSNHYYHTLYTKNPEEKYFAQTLTIASVQQPTHINNASNAMSISTCSSNTTKSLSSMASHGNTMSGYHRNGNDEYRKSNISTSTQASSSSTNSRMLMSHNNYFNNDVLDHDFLYNGATGKYEPITLSSSSSSSLNSKASLTNTSRSKNSKAIKSFTNTNEDHLDEIHFRNGKINQCDQFNGNAILQKRQINNTTTTNFSNKSIKQTTNINNNTANLTPVLYRKNNNSKTNIRSTAAAAATTTNSSGISNNGNNLLSGAIPATTARFTSHNNTTNTSSSMQSIQTANHHQQQSQQQHLHSHSQVPPHLVNTLSSPESAYSTGYSTDGTSPGKHINRFIYFFL